MKKIESLPLVLVCLLLFSCGSEEETKTDTPNYGFLAPVSAENYTKLIASEECTNIPRPADTYVYPIAPGTDAWIKLHEKGLNEVIKACQVPDYILRKISTPAVIQTFFDYPFSMELWASSSTYLNGFEKSVGHNSVYIELQKRKDAGKCLLERYNIFNPVGCDIAIFITPLFELLLAQPEFYSQLNSDEKKTCVKAALQKIKSRIDFDPALVHHNETTCFLIGRVMVSAKYSPFTKEIKNNKNLSQYLENQTKGYEDYNTILSHATQFIK